MKLEIVRDDAGFEALQPFWDRLLEQSATPTPFLRWDWVSLWWQECREHFRLAIGVVRDAAGAPEGIAPLVIGKEAEGARRHLRQLGFMNGLGLLQGERLDFIVRRGRESIVTPLLIGVFRECESEWDVLRLNKVPEESPNYPLLAEALAACGRDSGVLNRTECVFMDLPGRWQDYEMQHSGDWRRKMRRRWQILTEETKAQIRVAGRDYPAEQAFEEFVQLHALHWPAGVSSFLREPSLRLHRELARRWIPEGRLTLPCIEHEGRLIAGIYGLRAGNDLFQYQLGWHPDYARISLGNLAMRWSVEHAMSEGCSRYDFLPGAHDYKRSWSSHTRHVVDL
ncbi:MAG TPA: GNAT family N-acetyltransferase, partial [Prosthecobacter sp.]|nr:GNAT family N-acetyltransferase [Prosthecobacter sp.]